MTTQQTRPSSMDEAGLTALYEAGLYTQALDTIEEAGLLTALEEQPDAPGTPASRCSSLTSIVSWRTTRRPSNITSRRWPA